MTLTRTTKYMALGGAVLSVLVAGAGTFASSHREAPMIAGLPRLDATDLYAFRSYEAGREDTVTILANYFPLQDPYGGPNYFDLDDNALYEIHVDNDGDSEEDITFSFDFSTILAGVSVPVGNEMTAIPLVIAGGVGPGRDDTANVNSRQEYTLNMIEGDRREGVVTPITDSVSGASSFRKPLDYIGSKSIPDYASYAADHIYPINVPGCSDTGRVFVGQRQEGFAVNLGPVFDLVNLNPLGAEDAVPSQIADSNVTTLALEIPTSCLVASDDVIGVWTTSSMNFSGSEPMQVSRLGYPLINELVIGVPDKDKFNQSEPINDGQFVEYVTNPSLPFLLELLFSDAGAVAPTNFPREDLVDAIGGVPGLNLPQNIANGTFSRSEMLRLNTSIDPVDAEEQSNMGVLAGDNAGFPNGRRPGDDVVDIVLRAAMGALNPDSSEAPNNTVPFTDQSTVSAAEFKLVFPYLNDPLPGDAAN
ncbi:MAG: DUF4331 domain-containing protein [Gammaproteobacteria bacterium]